MMALTNTECTQYLLKMLQFSLAGLYLQKGDNFFFSPFISVVSPPSLTFLEAEALPGNITQAKHTRSLLVLIQR